MNKFFTSSTRSLAVTVPFSLLVLRLDRTLAEKNESITDAYEKLEYANVRNQNILHSHNDSADAQARKVIANNLDTQVREHDPDPSNLAGPIIVTGSAAIRKSHFIENWRRNPGEITGYNNGVRYLGVENFLSAAVQFCEEESRGRKIDIVSVGSYDGYIEKKILVAYHERFGESDQLDITLIDPDVECTPKVDFRYVDDLIRERPRIIENCVVFIFFPMPSFVNNGYDIDSIRKLKPKAILVEYDTTGMSGSKGLIEFLDPKSTKNNGISHYPIKEVLLQTNWKGFDVRLVKAKKKS